jgi:hypothetical protein
VGIAQSYRLFDWIDTRNYHVSYEVYRYSKGSSGERHSIDPDALFPRSLRHLLLQSYLVGNVWLQIDSEQLGEVRMSLLDRHAQRFARRDPGAGTIEVFSHVQRVTRENLSLKRAERSLLMRFHFEDGSAVLDLTDMEV